MARDCPDRQRGSDWRNNGGYGGRGGPRGAIGTGDAVDREMEVSYLRFLPTHPKYVLIYSSNS